MKIIINRDILFSLSSSPRINILKSLNIQRRTLGELAKMTSLSRANTYYHLQKLVENDLVIPVQTENIWIYYTLTEKGKHLIQPDKDDNIVLMIATGLITYSAGVILITNIFSLPRLSASSIFPILNPYLSIQLIIGAIFVIIGTIILFKNFFYRFYSYSFH
jgi:DNA-binding MarR family transcriptional regulator